MKLTTAQIIDDILKDMGLTSTNHRDPPIRKYYVGKNRRVIWLRVNPTHENEIVIDGTKIKLGKTYQFKEIIVDLAEPDSIQKIVNYIEANK